MVLSTIRVSSTPSVAVVVLLALCSAHVGLAARTRMSKAVRDSGNKTVLQPPTTDGPPLRHGDHEKPVMAMAELNSTEEAGCSYVSPESYIRQGKIFPRITEFTNPSFVSRSGQRTEGSKVLFYAYGPAFTQGGRPNYIAAWKYDPSDNFIKVWYPEEQCEGMCSSCCWGGYTNLPDWKSGAMNPSATGSLFSSYKLVKRFYAGDYIDLGKFGGGRLRHLSPDTWHLEGRVSGCYVAYAYVCGIFSGAAVKYKEADGTISARCNR